jgi:hypothetical protein
MKAKARGGTEKPFKHSGHGSRALFRETEEISDMRLAANLIATLSLALLAACASVSVPESAPTRDTGLIDLGGEWAWQAEAVVQQIALDKNGNGTYAWQNGRIVTTSVSDGRWEGTWHQQGNDRDGGFEILLSGDAMEGEGSWWYTRIGPRHLPPREQGGSFRLKRLSSVAAQPRP